MNSPTFKRETFNRAMANAEDPGTVEGWAVEYKGIRLGFHYTMIGDEPRPYWTVTELSSGMVIPFTDGRLRRTAYDSAVREIEKVGIETVRELIRKSVANIARRNV